MITPRKLNELAVAISDLLAVTEWNVVYARKDAANAVECKLYEMLIAREVKGDMARALAMIITQEIQR